MRKLFPLLPLLALLAVPASGECPELVLKPDKVLNPGEPALIEAQNVFEGNYTIEAFDRNLGAWVELGKLHGAGFALPELRFASDQTIDLRAVPETEGDCLATISVEVRGDPRLREDLGKVIVPVAGSLPGAYGSRWQTMMSLTNNSDTDTLRGTIVFHPAGRVASDDDPSMPYHLLPGQVAQWEDVVAALGGTGLGTIDIIPLQVTLPGIQLAPVPEIQTRIINVGENGTFGTDVPEVQLGEIVPPSLSPEFTAGISMHPKAGGIATAIVIPEDIGNARINLGARFFSFANKYYWQPGDPQGASFVNLVVRRGNEYLESVYIQEDAGYFNQYSLDELLTTELVPGDVVLVRAKAALTYWTLTDNRTNDPNFVLDYYTLRGDELLVY